MATTFRVRPGRLLALAVATAAFCAAFGASAAMAADPPADPQSFEQLFQQLQDTPVYKGACTSTCHGNIAQTKNYASAIIFKHGYHQLVACSSCHPRFPHRADATIERPAMRGCFDCHGVRHGPMGLIASDKCEDCHLTPRDRLRPAFHTFGWAGKEHVAPANKEFNTRCAMCHKPESCTECHDRDGIVWSPESWDYNAEDGCLSCHGNAALTKQSSGGQRSFQVTGLNASAHTDVDCQECHSDYRYDDKKLTSSLWTVNAGQACADCHAKQKEKNLSDVVASYNNSIHAEAIKNGNFEAATCGSCHGGHFIYRLDTDLAKQRMHMSAYRVCARCKQHGDDFDTYDDYYHGKAYKKGASDAPACWNCHNSHKIAPKADPDSTVSAANVGVTCGQAGCHKGSTEQFGAAAASLIHSKVTETEKNPLLRLISRITGG
jgi:hypothetical protein